MSGSQVGLISLGLRCRQVRFHACGLEQMTDNTQDNRSVQGSDASVAHLRVVGDRDFALDEPDMPGARRLMLPRWAVYTLVAFYCVAVWSLAFWVISALF